MADARLFARPELVRFAHEAAERGFNNTRSFKHWCATRGVTIYLDGAKERWVKPAEIDAAILRGARTEDADADAAAAEALNDSLGKVA